MDLEQKITNQEIIDKDEHNYWDQFKSGYLMPEIASKTGNAVGTVASDIANMSAEAASHLTAMTGLVPYLVGVTATSVKEGLEKDADSVKEKVANVSQKLAVRLGVTKVVGIAADYMYRVPMIEKGYELAGDLCNYMQVESDATKLGVAIGASLIANTLADIPFYGVVLPIEKRIDDWYDNFKKHN